MIITGDHAQGVEMRVLFVSVNMGGLVMPVLPIGAVSVASAVAQTANHCVSVADLPSGEPFENNLLPVIADFSPDCIALSVRNIDDQNIQTPAFLLDAYKKAVSACKKLTPAPIVLGGPGYSLYPEEILSYLDADIGIKGEGETLMPRLLEQMADRGSVSRLPNVLIKGGVFSRETYPPVSLSRLPGIDPELWPCPSEKRRDIFLPLQSRRGCPFSCTYCPNVLIEGDIIRKRSAEMFVADILRHVAMGYKKFFFTDNVFNLPLSYAKELCRRIIAAQIDISWVCSIYPMGADEALAELMARAGCTEINLSFESGSKNILQNMNKQFTTDEVRKIAAVFKGQGIKQTGFVLLGGPGETRQTAEQTFQFAESLELDAVNLTLGMRIYPGTALRRIAEEQKIIKEGDSLLQPTFYLEKALEGWLVDRTAAWLEGRHNWRCDLFRT